MNSLTCKKLDALTYENIIHSMIQLLEFQEIKRKYRKK